MKEKIEKIVQLRDIRLEEAKKETDEKLQFAGFCIVNTLNQVLDILGLSEEEPTEKEWEELFASIAQ